MVRGRRHENMTRAPYLFKKGYGLGGGRDSLIKDGLWDVYNNFHMGNPGELCATTGSREGEFDDFPPWKATRRARHCHCDRSLRSNRPVDVPQRKGATLLADDEEPNRVDLKKGAPPQAGPFKKTAV